MARYRLSEFNFDRFWNLFGRKKPQTIQQVIDNDPVLKKLDNDREELIQGFRPRLLKIKKEKPEEWDRLVKAGLVPKDYK
jgi:hypothetical protein